LSAEKKTRKKRLWKVPLIVLCTLGPVVGWLVFGRQGLLHLYHTEMERQAYIERIRQLTEENRALLDEIRRLRTDMSYVESVARKQFNMIRPNEVIYRFKKNKPHPDDERPLADQRQHIEEFRKHERKALYDEKSR